MIRGLHSRESSVESPEQEIAPAGAVNRGIQDGLAFHGRLADVSPCTGCRLRLIADPHYCLSSNWASTSTVMFIGSDPMPTALRAPTPFSGPNNSANRSLKPLITAG